jgi:hypothetical protein
MEVVLPHDGDGVDALHGGYALLCIESISIPKTPNKFLII